METGRTTGINYGISGNHYQQGFVEFYDSFGPDRESVEFFAPVFEETQRLIRQEPGHLRENVAVNYTVASALDDEDEEDDDDDLDVDELDLDEDEEGATEVVSDSDPEPDPDIIEDEDVDELDDEDDDDDL